MAENGRLGRPGGGMMEPINFIFSGQGSQEEGMGREILKNDRARSVVKKLSSPFGIDMEKLITSESFSVLKKTRFTQPAIFAVQAAYREAVMEKIPDLEITAAGGNSLGTYMALVVSGAMDMENAATLLKARAEAMGLACEKNPSTLRAFRGHRKFVEDLCGRAGGLSIALVNTPTQIIVGGRLSAFTNLDALLKREGYNPEDESNEFKMKELDVDGAFHTELMRDGIQIFEKALKTAEIREPVLPYFSDTSGSRETDPEKIRSLLLAQITNTVEWEKCIRGMGQACAAFLEASNKTTAALMIEAVDINFDVEAVSTLDEIDMLG